MSLIRTRLIQTVILALLVALLLFKSGAVASASDRTTDGGRSAQQQPHPQKMEPAVAQRIAVAHFPESKYEFEPTVEGSKVTHNFVLQNKGGAMLKIKGVKTTCGCTVASYPKQIPAGSEDNIKVQFNTTGYGGRTIHKSISIATNDPKLPQKNLNLSGKVLQFAAITPRFARLIGTQGEKIEMDITIKPESSYFFQIEEIKLKEEKNITCTLVESSEEVPEKYVLHIENISADAGRYGDVITVYTDSKIKPKITIGVYGYIKEKSSE